MNDFDQIILNRNAKMGFPKNGDKLTFSGVPEFYYPCFTKFRKDAEDNLELGKEYIIKECSVNSSWTSIVLEEFPELKFNLKFFKEK